MTESAAAAGSIRQWGKGASTTTGLVGLLATTLSNDFLLNNKEKFSTAVDEMLLFEKTLKKTAKNVESIDDLFEKMNREVENLLAVAADVNGNTEQAILFCHALSTSASHQIKKNRAAA